MVIYRGEQQGTLKETMLTSTGSMYLVEVIEQDMGEQVTKLKWWKPEECSFNGKRELTNVNPTPVGGEKS